MITTNIRPHSMSTCQETILMHRRLLPWILESLSDQSFSSPLRVRGDQIHGALLFTCPLVNLKTVGGRVENEAYTLLHDSKITKHRGLRICKQASFKVEQHRYRRLSRTTRSNLEIRGLYLCWNMYTQAPSILWSDSEVLWIELYINIENKFFY